MLLLSKDVPAATSRWPVLDDIVHRARWQQLTPIALVPGLAAGFTPGGILATPRRRGRQGRARWRRAIARTAIQPPLKLREPLVLTSNPSFQPPDLLIHPQQHRHHNLAALAINRLSLHTLHTNKFDKAQLCRPTQLNAYSFLWVSCSVEFWQ